MVWTCAASAGVGRRRPAPEKRLRRRRRYLRTRDADFRTLNGADVNVPLLTVRIAVPDC